MRALGLVMLAACSSPARPKHQAYPDLPVEPAPSGEAGAGEPLPFEPIGEGGDGTTPPVMPKVGDRMPAAGATSIPSTGCIPAGIYRVAVDLSSAHLSQNNTGMSDLAWCKSLLEAVPQAAMASMRIVVDGGQLSIEWPPGRPARLSPGGECSVVITSPPMVSSISFSNGKGSGTASYTVGTQNHPDESCSAAGAVLTIVPER